MNMAEEKKLDHIYECALMSKIVYDLRKDKSKAEADLPPGWLVFRKSFRKNNWNLGAVIYEKINCLDKPGEACLEKETEGSNKGKVILKLDVHWVIAFRGTEPSSVFNWMTNFVSPPNHRVDGINRETDNYCLSNSGVIILHFS